jgi:excisionase family DNA binding protein
MERPTLQYKLLTLQEVAAILRVNRSSVSRLLKSHDLPYVPVGGRKLICESDLAVFIDNHRVNKNDDCACRNGA